jgi:arginine exporter protein ArgO
MVSSFIEGLVAGFGIAIPFGPISVLIIETSIRKGLPFGLAAGAGAASADLLFASISAIAGAFVAAALAPYSTVVGIVSALFLIGLGTWGLRKTSKKASGIDKDNHEASSLIRTYFTILALTILNPLTIAYFSALILGKNPTESFSPGMLALFVGGAALASLSWQSLLAISGFLANKVLSDSFQKTVSVIGNLIIISFGIKALIQFI